MKYQTTNLQPTKRYPTYQFHARTAQKKLPAEQVFCHLCAGNPALAPFPPEKIQQPAGGHLHTGAGTI